MLQCCTLDPDGTLQVAPTYPLQRPRGLAATRQVTWRRLFGNIFPLSRICGTIGVCNPWKLPTALLHASAWVFMGELGLWKPPNHHQLHLARMRVIMASLRFRASCVFWLSNKYIQIHCVLWRVFAFKFCAEPVKNCRRQVVHDNASWNLSPHVPFTQHAQTAKTGIEGCEDSRSQDP